MSSHGYKNPPYGNLNLFYVFPPVPRKRGTIAKMEMELLWLILSVLLGGYVFVFGFLRRFNEWYYVRRLGKTQYPLPPGDMGWPYLGGLPTFLKAFKSDDPDSYIYSLVSKSLSLSLSLSHSYACKGAIGPSSKLSNLMILIPTSTLLFPNISLSNMHHTQYFTCM